MKYTKSLRFDEEPDYVYMLSLFENIGLNKDFDIFDNRYDWNTKAVLLQDCYDFYCSISKNGRLNIHAHNYYIKQYHEICENLRPYVSADKPYFIGQSNIVFDYIKNLSYYESIVEECNPIVRSQFEVQLSNVDLGLAYVEIFSEDNEYYSKQIDENSEFFDQFSNCYYLFKNRKLEFCFYK